MSTGIEWTDETWNPVTGCTKVSPGCDHCYAERITNRFGGPGAFDTVVLHEDRLDQPFHWRKPRRVFVNSMSDLFHDDVPEHFIFWVFDRMRDAPQHTFQVLTKRPGRMASVLTRYYDCDHGGSPSGGCSYCQPFSNVWLGVSVENQKWADVRIPKLLETPAAVRFLSCEPLLGPVELGIADHRGHERDYDGGYNYICLTCSTDEQHVSWFVYDNYPALDWVIVGGESGPGARPMHPEWARSLRDQCVAASVPFFFKQWGEWAPSSGGRVSDGQSVCLEDGQWLRRVGKKAAGRALDGQTWSEFPASLASLPV